MFPPVGEETSEMNQVKVSRRGGRTRDRKGLRCEKITGVQYASTAASGTGKEA